MISLALTIMGAAAQAESIYGDSKDVKFVYQVSATGSRYPEKLFGLTKSPEDEPE